MPSAKLTSYDDELSQSNGSCHLLDQAQRYLLTADKRMGVDSALEEAWQQFHALYTSKIRKFAFSCGATDQEINDCVQEVWTELLVRLPSFRFDPTRGSFDTWLFSIVRGKTVDQLRSRKRCQAFKDVDDIRSLADDRTGDAQLLEDAELLSLADSRLKQRLSECNYQILRMRLVENRSAAEVAECLGITQEQVWYRYHRARREAEQIGALRANGNCVSSIRIHRLDDETENSKKSAQGISNNSVSRVAESNSIVYQRGSCVDYVFQKLELGRRELTPEWKVEWEFENGEPKPVLYIRKMAIVAYAEICGAEEVITEHWPRIANAAIAAGVATGIATILNVPSGALACFQKELGKQLQGRSGAAIERLLLALSAVVEANGPWFRCEG